jgi:AcrR family transcriptional regulator
MATAERPLRADAERNRQRILAAAAEVFASRGLDVSLDDIAHAAGVGVGTVYRRFPSKDDLIDALFEDKIEEVVALATEALAIEDPWESFEAFTRGMCRKQAHDRGIKELLIAGDRGHARVRAGRERIAPIAFQIVRRAQEAGVVRADLRPFDVPLMHMAVGHVADRTREVAPDYFERTLTLLIDGIRPSREGTTPMPAEPLDAEQFVAAMARRDR